MGAEVGVGEDLVGFADGLEAFVSRVVAGVLICIVLVSHRESEEQVIKGEKDVPGWVMIASFRYAFLISSGEAFGFTPKAS